MTIYSKIKSHLIYGTGKNEVKVSFEAESPFEVPDELGKSLLNTFPDTYYEEAEEETPDEPIAENTPSLTVLKMQVGRLKNNPEKNADKIAEIEKQIAELEK